MVLLLLTFCLLLLPLWESVIVLCFVVRYFMSILVLQSSWWRRESWLLCLICLPGVSWWLRGSSLRCHRVVCSWWLWYFLIILTYYFYYFSSCCFSFCCCIVFCFVVVVVVLGGFWGGGCSCLDLLTSHTSYFTVYCFVRTFYRCKRERPMVISYTS